LTDKKNGGTPKTNPDFIDLVKLVKPDELRDFRFHYAESPLLPLALFPGQIRAKPL
jgi:hypothetical protein